MHARQVRKTWQLKHLTRLEAIDGEAGEASPAALELCFVNNAFTSEARLALRAEDPAALTDLLGALFLFCRRGPGRWPTARHLLGGLQWPMGKVCEFANFSRVQT